MATFRLAVITIVDPVDPSFLAGDEVLVMWDGSTSAIIVTKNGSPFTTPGATLGQPDTNYRIVIGVSSYEGGYAVSGYSFCSGADLHWFRMVTTFPEFPFFAKQITINSPVCAAGGGVVCDIHFTGVPAITHASDISTGGSVTVTAESSNGTVKYGLSNVAYSEMTNTTGTFTGLLPGTWTIHAKDANDCAAVKSVNILFKPTAEEHYRFSWGSLEIGAGLSRSARLRIYEREYPGDVVDIDHGGEVPFILNKPKQGDLNNKLYPIHPTNAVLSLMSERDYQFLPLFTQDNKRYRAVYEVFENSTWVEAWQGFFDPNIYREDFVNTPYTTEFQIVDNVKILEKEPFTDDDGNLLYGDMKLIKVISHIMNKTGLNLNIRSGVNIFETSHTTTASSDPLDQTYIDVACYRKGAEPFTCWQVLEAILKPFGARIYQVDAQWWIEEIDRATASYTYRIFDSSGVYVSNGTFDPVLDIKSSSESDRVVTVDEDQSMEVIPAYGKITITSELNYIGSMIAGGFEKEDLLSPESETFSLAQGVYTSEEGFKDWTLRLNGTSGVSFGRVVVGRRGDSSRIGFQGEDDLTRSVGAFFYNASAWNGNLRNAYVESAAKPYQYGPGDEINFKAEYSTPAKPEYSFMVFRFMIKLGSNYLQQDLSWSTTEHIFRAYPPISNSLQEFELGIPVPETDVVVDTTMQVRIYFYASEFYDFGLPPATTDPADGTDGQATLKALATINIDYDYRLDFRLHQTTGSVTNYGRVFAELRYSTAAEDLGAGVIRPNDFNATTNPKIWSNVGAILENNPVGNRRGVDRKFYLDNIAVDALINGQPPPTEDTRILTISKYINENLEVDLYNFDVPDITNAKNMYNNYFKLSSGSPTTLWTRSGISELLPLRDILLKVLGANHSAPTFRLTGTFINEYSRIGINNCLRLTKPSAAISLTNTTFATNLTGWTQAGVGTSFTWNSGAQVVLSGAVNSQKIYQDVSHKGGYIQISQTLTITPATGSTREDILWAVFYNGTSIIHAEKLKTFSGLTSATTAEISHTAFAPGQVTGIGFFLEHVSGAGDCTYVFTLFNPTATNIQEVYQIADYQFNERANEYWLELMQMSKTYISLTEVDTGGTNQGGGTTGREHSSAYSSAYS